MTAPWSNKNHLVAGGLELERALGRRNYVRKGKYAIPSTDLFPRPEGWRDEVPEDEPLPDKLVEKMDETPYNPAVNIDAIGGR
jgi:hypothetical protein